MNTKNERVSFYLLFAGFTCLSMFCAYFFHINFKEILTLNGEDIDFERFKFSATFLFCLVSVIYLMRKIDKMQRVISLNNELNSTKMKSNNFWASLSLFLLKLNCVAIPLFIIQFIFGWRLIQDSIQDFVAAIFMIQFVLTFLSYRIAYINEVKGINDSLDKLSDKFNF